MYKVRGTPIAAAIALALSPFAVGAESGFYGSVRIGLEYIDAGGTSVASASLRNFASRIGFSGETDLNNGMTAFGKLEFGVDTRSDDNDDGSLSTRHAYIGLKGQFGSLTLGQSYHTWYKTVIGPVDQPWWGSCNGCIANVSRTSDGLSYSGEFGFLAVGATAYMIPTSNATNEFSEDIDGFEIGLTYDTNFASFGLGMRDMEGSEPVIGVVAKGDYGSIGYAANLTMQDGNALLGTEDGTGMDLFLSFGNAYLDVGTIERGDSSMGVTLGYTYSLGRATTSWFEISNFDSGIDGEDATMSFRAALKYDWK